jgi:hypothetical protein
MNRATRELCWLSRDEYFGCLDRVGVLHAGKEQGEDCIKERDGYHQNCAKSWASALLVVEHNDADPADPAQIDYFNKRRLLQQRS